MSMLNTIDISASFSAAHFLYFFVYEMKLLDNDLFKDEHRSNNFLRQVFGSSLV